jgi:uncharacterized protein (DUF2062 family)
MASKIIENFTHKVLIPFRLVPKDGLSPEKLAFSVTIGLLTGLFPVFGATTLLSLLFTFIFRQNLMIVQSVQWIMGVFQVLMIIPFMRLGVWLLNQPEIQINIDQIKMAFQFGLLQGIKTMGVFHLFGIVGWIVVALPFGSVFYFGLLKFFRRKL